jgi:hypothetical protein
VEKSLTFGQWLNQVAPGISNYKIAVGLDPDNPKTHRVGRWRTGKEKVSANQAYAIGNLLSPMYPANPLDALIAAGHWEDAIGILGEYLYENGSPTPQDDISDYDWILSASAGVLYGKALPATIQAAVERAWQQWQLNKNPNGKGKDVRHFDAKTKAAYLLASSKEEDDATEAVQIMTSPASQAPRFVLNRKVRRERPKQQKVEPKSASD